MTEASMHRTSRLARHLTLCAAAAVILGYLLTPALQAWHLATEHVPQQTEQTTCSHSHSHGPEHAPVPGDPHEHDDGEGSCAVCEGFVSVRHAIYGSFDPPIGVLSPTADAPVAAPRGVAPSTADLASYPSRGPPRV